MNKIISSQWFAIEIDESRHVSNDAILLHVRFTDYCKENTKEEMLRCLELKTYTTGTSKSTLNKFIEKKVLVYVQMVKHK
jgi:hypothetical protein